MMWLLTELGSFYCPVAAKITRLWRWGNRGVVFISGRERCSWRLPPREEGLFYALLRLAPLYQASDFGWALGNGKRAKPRHQMPGLQRNSVGLCRLPPEDLKGSTGCCVLSAGRLKH